MELKIFSFNLNGIRAFLKKNIYKEQNFIEYINSNDYTIIGLQEVKVNKKSENSMRYQNVASEL
jgi:exonuclease III